MIKKVASTIGGLGLLLLTPFQTNQTEAHEYIGRGSQPQITAQSQSSFFGLTFNKTQMSQYYPVVKSHISIECIDTQCGPVYFPQTNQSLKIKERRWKELDIDYNIHNSIGAKLLRGLNNEFKNARTDICQPRGYFHPHLNAPSIRPAPCPPINPCPQPCDTSAPYSNSQSTIIFEQAITPRPNKTQWHAIPQQPTLAPKEDCGCN